MDAKVAARQAGKVRAARERAEARKAASESRAFDRQLRKDLPGEVRRAKREIAGAVRAGDRSCYVHFWDGGEGRALASRVADHLRAKMGYRAEVEIEERDMGDSAAPCRTTCVGIQVSWGRED